MKNLLPKFVKAVILLGLLFLPMLTRGITFSTDTIPRAEHQNPTKYLPYIVRDLKECDLIKQENKILDDYNRVLFVRVSELGKDNYEANMKLSKKVKSGKIKNYIILGLIILVFI